MISFCLFSSCRFVYKLVLCMKCGCVFSARNEINQLISNVKPTEKMFERHFLLSGVHI